MALAVCFLVALGSAALLALPGGFGTGTGCGAPVVELVAPYPGDPDSDRTCADAAVLRTTLGVVGLVGATAVAWRIRRRSSAVG